MTVPTATPRSRHAERLRARRRRSQARARWLALAVVVGVLVSVTVLLAAFDGAGGSSNAIPTVGPAPVQAAPPEPTVLAAVSNLRIRSPVAQGGVTAVGFHGSADGGLELQPVGPQANDGILARLWHRVTGSTKRGGSWYQLDGSTPRTLVVGAVAGTDVYAPVDGTVVAIRSQVISGVVVGAEIELRPSSAPSLVVALRNVRPDRQLTVGANVVAGSSKLGSVVNVARYEHQALAEYAPGEGNNVSLQVHPSASLAVP